MSKSSELTSIELKKLAVGQVDLAAGYPNLKLPNWIEKIYNDRIGQEYSEEFSWPVGKLRDIDECLKSAVSSLLALDDKLAKNMCILPNGTPVMDKRHFSF